VAPVATNSCGTFFEFMYFWIAVFGGVPSGLKMKSTSSLSTSFAAACSTVFRRAVAVVVTDEIDLAARLMPPSAFDLVEVGPVRSLPITP